MINLTDVTVSLGGRRVLDIPALTFERGVRYAVIGANGSGKTTLLKIIAGTMRPGSGTVFISADVSANRGYMPQKPYIFSFSVLKNVTLTLERGMPEKAAVEALRSVGMESFLQARGRGLSGGEAQRVALARILALPRPLVILDEPTSATDIAGTDLVESALKKYAEKTGCMLIFSTHSPAQALRLADRALMLDGGQIVENGPAEEVLRRPRSPQGAAFLRHWDLNA